MIKIEVCIRGNVVLCVLIGLLIGGTSQAEDSLEAQGPVVQQEPDAAFLKLRLDLLENRYRRLCHQYATLAYKCSASDDLSALSCSACPDGWLHVEDQCFHLSTDRASYSNSSQICSEMGAHLATLTTKEQHDAVTIESSRIGGSLYYFIGLNDIEKEGEWRWEDKKPLEIPFWSTDYLVQPDNYLWGETEGEDCAVVDALLQTWYDVPCHFTYRRICQKAALPVK
ncbi:C-type lectin domain family 4 member D-like [Plectropomus leopardus]|uniref:C-type lectin domain family 4 member D-like n=1 Tax=Plectropomus leopardus TaxID=160734 RepID=UPI001C4C36BE|nr:C-type lectin domain family 4 member D-like [Plectropomus leopardus]